MQMLSLFNTLHLWVLSHTKSEKGATAVEYGLMVSLIAVAIIAAVSGVATALITLFGKVSAAL